MNNLKAKIRVKTRSGKIIIHTYSFHDIRLLNRWKRDLIGKKKYAYSRAEARRYGGSPAKIISVKEIKSRIDRQRLNRPRTLFDTLLPS